MEKNSDLPHKIQPTFLDFVPLLMRETTAWVNWRYRTKKDKDGNTAWTKEPLNPHNTKKYASSTASSTWGTFAQAIENETAHCGIGFVFARPFFGIDIDHCLTPDGEMTSFAKTILARFSDTYAEWSPSGTGIHIYGTGDYPLDTGRKITHGTQQVEIYTEKRFFTVTGNPLTVSIPTLRAFCQDDFTWLLSLGSLIEKPARASHMSIDTHHFIITPPERLLKLFLTNPKLQNTWDGTRLLEGTEGDQSESARDMACARFFAQAGCTQQETYNLLKQRRLVFGIDEKGESALKTTVENVFTSEEAREKEKAEDARDPQTLTNDERQAHALQILKMALVKIIQWGKNPAMYEVHFADDEPALINSVEEFDTAKVWERLAMSRKQADVQLDRKRWTRTKRLLLSMIVYEDMPETQLNAQTENWLRGYVGRKSTRGNPGPAWIESGEPFADQHAQYLTLAHFLNHVHVSCGARHVPLHALAGRIIQLGFREETVERADERGNATRQYWVRHLQTP